MRVLFVVLIVLLLGVGYAGPPRLLLYRPHASLTVTPLALPAARRIGRLTWLGGATLRSDDPAFGGFSALAVRGDRFLLLSDGGNLAGFRLGSDWRPRALRFGELPAGPRSGWEKRDRDSESLTLDRAGRAWVGFESANALWRYAPGFSRGESHSQPPAMQRWPSGGGAEALLRLRDGRMLVLSEEGHWPHRRGRAGLVFTGDPTEQPERGFRFSYRPAPGFDPTDATQLPTGDILVLERQWRFPVSFRSRIALLPRTRLRPGAVVIGQEVARFAPPFPTENYEGIAVTREAGRTIVWLVSDNDQSWWRRSYLMKFRLD